jgi:hypothetical protein
MTKSIDNIYVTDQVTLSNKSQSVKIYPYGGVALYPMPDTEFLKQEIGNPLREWCTSCFNSSYSLAFRFNSGDPYWSLICESGEDFTQFMLRYGHLNKN